MRPEGTLADRGDGGGLKSMNDDGDASRRCGSSRSLPLPSTRRKDLLDPPEPDPPERRSELDDAVPRYSRANDVDAHVLCTGVGCGRNRRDESAPSGKPSRCRSGELAALERPSSAVKYAVCDVDGRVAGGSESAAAKDVSP